MSICHGEDLPVSRGGGSRLSTYFDPLAICVKSFVWCDRDKRGERRPCIGARNPYCGYKGRGSKDVLEGRYMRGEWMDGR